MSQEAIYNPNDNIRIQQLDEYGLPIVPCMVHPRGTDGVEFVIFALDELKRRASMDVSARWALETIAELQRLWYGAVDKLQQIEEIVHKGIGSFDDDE